MKSAFAVLLLTMTILTGCTSQNSFEEALPTDDEQKASVIWDEDTRQDLSGRDQTASLAQATALFIRDSRLRQGEGGNYTFEARSLKSAYPICEGEKYIEQNILGFCSGVLISPSQVLTAGHCVNEEKSCDETYVTFGHTQFKAMDLKIPGREVYRCKRILKLDYSSTRDYAIIELDRDVTGAEPVKMGSGDALQTDEPVVSLSYPLGLPLKKDDGSVFQNSNGGFYLRAKVDTFAGSSGSPLFNSKNELVGILSSGTEDFDEDEIHRIQSERKNGDCINFKRCKDNNCFGERFLKVEGIEFPK